jgi:hypothetical protein
MDRTIVYPGSIPLDTDMLNLNRNTMVALGALIAATLGSTTVVDGLVVGPTAPASMNIQIGPGSITAITTIDATNYGTLPADIVEPLVKMGVNTATSYFTCTAPNSPGQSMVYLIQAAFLESDSNPVVLPYYNAVNPAVPFLGPGNLGGAQPTSRTQRVQLSIKAGASAPTGSQVPPDADAGCIGISTVRVDAGATAIPAANIAAIPTSPVVPFKLPALRPGFSSLASFTASGNFVVPLSVTRAKITVVGGGGAGGGNPTLPGGGGGAGGQAVLAVDYLVPGSVIPVTVGAGGIAAGLAPGGNGGSSSFGTIVSATGGTGGGNAPGASAYTGGNGGAGVGGGIDYGGAFGTDGIPAGSRGGDGGGPGCGRGATSAPGLPAAGFGGGGGGGAAGYAGANGAAGLVIVEY